jgi:hypothetical protein
MTQEYAHSFSIFDRHGKQAESIGHISATLFFRLKHPHLFRISGRAYRKLFSSKYPETAFISLGGTNDVEKDAIKVSAAIDQLFTSIKMSLLFDRDDRSEEEIKDLHKNSVRVLRKRDIENYLWDDDIIARLCAQVGQPEKTVEILALKSELLEKSKSRGNPTDDIKSISGELYVEVKKRLSLTKCGNNKESFCISTLAPLVTADTEVFKMLEEDIFS